jgi:hypothetical protein
MRTKEKEREYNKRAYEKNKEKRKAAAKAYHETNREIVIEKMKRRYDDPEYTSKAVARALEWDKSHPMAVKERVARYTKRTQPQKNARTALYRAQKLQATPPWLTIEQKRQIQKIYKDCPRGYHVDHIEPLNGKDRKGLHVPWNLQILPKLDNLKKSNK